MPGAFRSADATVSARGLVAITASDATVFPVCRAIYVGVAGNIALRTAEQQTVTLVAVANGMLPVQADMVLSTGTTATDMFAVY